MPRACASCIHPERAAIDHALRAGAPQSEVASAFNLPIDGISRHWRLHVAPKPSSTSPVELIHRIAEQLGSLAATATTQGDSRSAIDAIKSQLSAVEFALRLETEQKAKAKAESVLPDTAFFDRLVADVEKNYDRCPHCHQLTIFKLPKIGPESPQPN
jgi:hypothetical protein